jgi:hypothetical protein
MPLDADGEIWQKFLFNVYQQDDVFEEKYKHYSNV